MKHLSIVLVAGLAFAPLTQATENKRQTGGERARSQSSGSRMAARPRMAPPPQRLARPARLQRSMNPVVRRSMPTVRPRSQRSFAGLNANRAIQRRGRERSFTPPRIRTTPRPVARQFPAVTATANAGQRNRRVRQGRGNAEFNRQWQGRGQNRDQWRNRADSSSPRAHGSRGRRGNWRERHREWHERHEGDPNFEEKHRNFHRRHHRHHGHRDRTWWRNNYSRFVLFGSGYYYWNSGYWYPAYGYDPYFSTYTYDAPIYAYNDLDPGQVIAAVQEELQRRGYYHGALDGDYGPMTRRALLNYQQDTGLPVTGEIDQATLESLGFE